MCFHYLTLVVWRRRGTGVRSRCRVSGFTTQNTSGVIAGEFFGWKGRSSEREKIGTKIGSTN